MRRGLILLAICALPAVFWERPASAAADQLVELDPAHTAIAYTVSTTLHAVHGNFKLKRGSLKFDSATGAAAGEIVVDATSGNSGDGARDRRMAKEVLESAKFPEAVFTADRINGALAQSGESQLDVHGNFRIHGADHELTLRFRAEVKDGAVKASTAFTIPYIQWGMKNPGNFLLKVAAQVEMEIQAIGRVQ